MHNETLNNRINRLHVDTFTSRLSTNYRLHYHSEFRWSQVNSVFSVTETISYAGSKIRDLVPLEMREKDSLATLEMSTRPGNHKLLVKVMDSFEF